MGNVAANVSTGKPKVSGAVYRAPKGTTLPTDATTALASDYVCLGYVSEDGIENNNEMDVAEVKAWGGNIVYRSLTQLNDTFALTLIESENIDTLKAVYGDSNVTQTSSSDPIVIDVKAEDPVEAVFVFEIALRGGKAKRIIVPDGAITSRDAISYKDDEAIGYGITISAYPDANGSTHKEYIA